MPQLESTLLSIGRIASLACHLEVCASKPGNVHRGADFDDTTFTDFVVSAELLGQTIDSRKTDELGKLILDAVKNRKSLVTKNTNLGMILLICPLAIVANDGDLSSATMRKFLKETTPKDAANIFEAIRMAQAGGLGKVQNLMSAMIPVHHRTTSSRLCSCQVIKIWSPVSTPTVSSKCSTK